MSILVLPNSGAATIPVLATGRGAFYSESPYQVDQVINFPNYPESRTRLFQGRGAFTTGAFANGATLLVQAAGAAAATELYYSAGINAVVTERSFVKQVTPGVLNATGALTTALLTTGIVTSTTAAAVTATLDTGTVTDTSGSFAIDDVFYWSVINTGPNAFTVTAAAGHTIVGTAAVATVTSARWATRKTAANTFVSYRLS
jgi:hypothetical protein